MQISKCYVINEESHGAIGAAQSPKAAAEWLIATGWVEEYTDYSIFHPHKTDPRHGEWEHMTIRDYCDREGIADWEHWFIDNASPEWLEEHFCVYLYRMDYAVDE
jgi:hypothetical protein